MAKTMEVYTKEDFEKAAKEMPEKIILKGEIAEEVAKKMHQKAVAKNVGIGAGVLSVLAIAAGVVAAPFTGGVSIPASMSVVATTTAATGAATAITLTAGELFIASTAIVSVVGIAASVVNKVIDHYDVAVKVGNGKCNTCVELTRK